MEAIFILVPQPVSLLGAELMALNLVGLWIALRPLTLSFINTGTTVIGRHEDVPRDSINCGYLLGIAGGITLIQSSRWGCTL